MEETNEPKKKFLTFGVYIPSYNRSARGVVTGKLFENPHYVVRQSQKELYEKEGFPNVIGVEDEKVNRYSKVFNWIIENATEDIILIIDDDVKGMKYRLDSVEKIEDVETIQAEFERIGQMLWDLDLGLAFGTATAVPWSYTSEFRFSGVPGAFKLINRKKLKARMEYTFPRNVDIDFVLQEVLKNRICLNALYICGDPYIDKLTNTTGSRYNQDSIKASVEMMKLKWGKYFGYNFNSNVPKIFVKRGVGI